MKLIREQIEYPMNVVRVMTHEIADVTASFDFENRIWNEVERGLGFHVGLIWDFTVMHLWIWHVK